MGTPAEQANLGAYQVALISFKPQTCSDATEIVGATVDRNSYGFAQSVQVLSNLAYTGASGDATGVQTVRVRIYDSTSSAMSGEAVFKTKSWTITWVSDAAKQAFLVLPADLTNAKRYVRAKFTVTKSGTITISAQTASQSVTFAGLHELPASSFADAGYGTATDTLAAV